MTSKKWAAALLLAACGPSSDTVIASWGDTVIRAADLRESLRQRPAAAIQGEALQSVIEELLLAEAIAERARRELPNATALEVALTRIAAARIWLDEQVAEPTAKELEEAYGSAPSHLRKADFQSSLPQLRHYLRGQRRAELRQRLLAEAGSLSAATIDHESIAAVLGGKPVLGELVLIRAPTGQVTSPDLRAYLAATGIDAAALGPQAPKLIAERLAEELLLSGHSNVESRLGDPRVRQAARFALGRALAAHLEAKVDVSSISDDQLRAAHAAQKRSEPFEAVRAELAGELLAQKRRAVFAQFVAELRRGMMPTIDLAAASSVASNGS